MGILSTAIAVHAGTSATRKELRRSRNTPERFNRQQAEVTRFLSWFDALPDAGAWQYAATILGSSRGSRHADREALSGYVAARVF